MARFLVGLLVLGVSGAVWADSFGSGDHEFAIEFVLIGDAGNSGDIRDACPDVADPYGCGAVGYEYRIGKYEITNGQWDAFVAGAGAPNGNPSDAYDNNGYWEGEDLPSHSISWYEAAQFCNYLTSGDKSLGAYVFSGDNTAPGDFLAVDRDWALSAFYVVYVIPTEDEWYKAAYYDGSGYWTYANGSNLQPIADEGWNYFGGEYEPHWAVGTGTMEQNGTFDMMGNVYEWNETLVGGGLARGYRGGACNASGGDMASFDRTNYGDPNKESDVLGLRVAAIGEYVVTGCEYALAGDLNDDCRVDLVDFSMLVSNWLVDCYADPSDPACVLKQ
ncbi:MAG: SUMF1/EgtB/PvdO family nonheme iron enzyme [Sedimentisphaerales bacterium]|nr:SUMF1/EgtB/PvdO family nonheme iron enzyme [Sedimentisphaerales bacterium]